MVVNNLSKLNDVLFDQLLRLTDDSITDDFLEEEINRSKAVSSIARDIIANSKLALDVVTVQKNMGNVKDLPRMLENGVS